MPEEKVKKRARRAKKEGKAPTTQAGEFVREEIHHVREGKHGASSPQQAIAIGLSKARRAGVDLPPPEPGTTSEKTRRSAKPVSKRALSRQARRAAARRGPAKRSAAAKKAVRTKGPTRRKAAAKKAARTRAARR